MKSPEELNPDPFMDLLPDYGMEWHVRDELTGEVDPEEHPFAVPALAA